VHILSYMVPYNKRRGREGRRESQPELDPQTFEIEFNAKLTPDTRRLGIREQRRQNRDRTTNSAGYTECD
jgi:hypothetical protein